MREIGLFDSIFSKKQAEQKVNGYFKMLNAYTPSFSSYEGGIYEMELTRAAIHSFASACSKLKPEIQGAVYRNLAKQLQFKMNPFMDTSKFLYRLATILSVNNTAFIIPLMDDYENITGYYPLLPQHCEVMDYKGQAFLRYRFSNGLTAAIEYERVGVLTQFQYISDFFGENNTALYPTMNLLSTQNQGIIEGVKSSANIRFMARLANIFKPDDIIAERKRFTEDNLTADNNSGVMMFDNKYADVKQIDSKPFIVDAEQMAIINNNVFNYFGTSESIIQNKYTSSEFNAWYEGKIEPFAIQLSLVMSNMTYTQKEIARGNQIIFSANRLQYMENKDKLLMVTQLFDRGMINQDTANDIFSLPTLPDGKGQKYFIRGEYVLMEEKNSMNEIEEVEDANQPEQGIQNDDADSSQQSEEDRQ